MAEFYLFIYNKSFKIKALQNEKILDRRLIKSIVVVGIDLA